MLTVKYHWKELTEEGLLLRFIVDYQDYYYFGDAGFDTEEEALEAFGKTFDVVENYLSAKYVLVKCYGVE